MASAGPIECLDWDLPLALSQVEPVMWALSPRHRDEALPMSCPEKRMGLWVRRLSSYEDLHMPVSLPRSGRISPQSWHRDSLKTGTAPTPVHPASLRSICFLWVQPLVDLEGTFSGETDEKVSTRKHKPLWRLSRLQLVLATLLLTVTFSVSHPSYLDGLVRGLT